MKNPNGAPKKNDNRKVEPIREIGLETLDQIVGAAGGFDVARVEVKSLSAFAVTPAN